MYIHIFNNLNKFLWQVQILDHCLPQFSPIYTIICSLQINECQPQLTFSAQTMLYNSLEDQDLFCGAVVSSETSLGGSVEIEGISCCGKPYVHGGHEQFGKWGGDCDRAVVCWGASWAFSFVYCLYL